MKGKRKNQQPQQPLPATTERVLADAIPPQSAGQERPTNFYLSTGITIIVAVATGVLSGVGGAYVSGQATLAQQQLHNELAIKMADREDAKERRLAAKQSADNLYTLALAFDKAMDEATTLAFRREYGELRAASRRVSELADQLTFLHSSEVAVATLQVVRQLQRTEALDDDAAAIEQGIIDFAKVTSAWGTTVRDELHRLRREADARPVVPEQEEAIATDSARDLPVDNHSAAPAARPTQP
jgi:hypothetical protein